jgi:hypothetical protein
MAVVVGVFDDQAQAVDAYEHLHMARIDAPSLRLISDTSRLSDLVAETGAGTDIAAGPAHAVVGVLPDSEVTPDSRSELESRLSAGATLVLADGLDENAARDIAAYLRDQRADKVLEQY